MSAAEIASILVAVVAALGAWAAQRTASKTAKINTQVSGRLEAERGAYERARKFDTETIKRQDEEIKQLRELNDELRLDLETAMDRIKHLEDVIIPEIERQFYER